MVLKCLKWSSSIHSDTVLELSKHLLVFVMWAVWLEAQTLKRPLLFFSQLIFHSLFLLFPFIFVFKEDDPPLRCKSRVFNVTEMNIKFGIIWYWNKCMRTRKKRFRLHIHWKRWLSVGYMVDYMGCICMKYIIWT